MATLAPSWACLQRREERLRRLYDALLGAFSPDIICEVGAFNGDETQRFHQLSPDSEFYLFEANSKNVRQFLHGNPALANHPRTVIEHVAVSDQPGELEFNILEADEVASDWRRAAGSMLQRGDGLPSTSEKVTAITLDDYFEKQLANEDVSFALWIDVEGVLDRVLNGATRVLERTVLLRAEIEWEEVWQGQKLGQDSKDVLERLGFCLIGDSFVPESHNQSDVVYVRRDALGLVEPAKW
jgi:FkbM family methyltransferase